MSIEEIIGKFIESKFDVDFNDFSDGTLERWNNMLTEIQASIEEKTKARIVSGETSDGYHTFNELYDYRRVYNAALFNEWAKQGKYDVHKSLRHSDGELCFGGGWFIVMATLPTGQISNHYQAEYWNDFEIPELPCAAEYDGHTPQEALERIKELKNE